MANNIKLLVRKAHLDIENNNKYSISCDNFIVKLQLNTNLYIMSIRSIIKDKSFFSIL